MLVFMELSELWIWFIIERNAVLVTNNVKHFSRLDGIQIENWAE